MRPAAAVVAVLLLTPAAAHASGSSTVFADSRYFRVALESVRKIFARDDENPDAESNWHAEWKRNNQPRVNKLRAALQAPVALLATEYGLLPFKADYPEVAEGDEEDRGDILQSKKPFLYRFRFEDVYVSLAFKKLPSESARRAIKERLQKRLPR